MRISFCRPSCSARFRLAVIARITRSSMLEVLSEDYVRTAKRAKGLSPFRVVGLHALRNALIPVVTVIGLQIGTALAGAVLTETIFSWPGVGKWLIESIARRDYPALQGGILLISSMRHRHESHHRRALWRDQSEDSPWSIARWPPIAAGGRPSLRRPAATACRRLLVAPLRENKGAVIALWSRPLHRVPRAYSLISIAPLPAGGAASRGRSGSRPIWAEGGSTRFWLGTDDLGRDILSRVIHGARISLFIGLSVMIISLACGVALGLVQRPFRGGIADTIIMRLHGPDHGGSGPRAWRSSSSQCWGRTCSTPSWR